MITNFLRKSKTSLKKLKEVFQGKLPSVEHRNAWSDYDRILMYRANVTFVSKLIFMMIWSALGQANF